MARWSVPRVVWLVAAVLVACCAAWAVVAQRMVPDVCSLDRVPDDAGPVRCAGVDVEPGAVPPGR